MNLFNKISFIILVAVLCFVISKAANSADLNHESDYELEQAQQQATIFPTSTPELFGIHRQGKSAVNLLRTLLLPNAKTDDNDNPNPGILSEIPIRSAVSIYLCFSRDINQSLTIRELLFPFHHFL